MFVVVTGGSGSGKSEYAESKVVEFASADRYYIATMMCFDEESKKRVQRHRMMRSGKGFETIERFLDLKSLELPQRSDPRESVTVLLECMSNLAANEVFDPKGSGERAAEEILEGVRHLLTICDHLVIVTNEVFSDGYEYDPETQKYQKILGKINCEMAKLADEVTEVVYTIPVCHKRRIRG